MSSHNFGAYYAYCPESDTFNFTTTKGAKFFNPNFPPHVSGSKHVSNYPEYALQSDMGMTQFVIQFSSVSESFDST